MAKKITIEVDPKDLNIDNAATLKITDLEKQIKSLERKLKNRDEKIAALQQGMDMSKEVRTKVHNLCEELVAALKINCWVDDEDDCW